MKKIFFIAFCFLFVAFTANAQRYAVIDTKYILDKLPEYKNADKQIQQISSQWQKEIDDKQAELDKMYKNYDAEQFMLSDELKKKKRLEIYRKSVSATKEIYLKKDRN
jgi:outer membrane protein